MEFKNLNLIDSKILNRHDLLDGYDVHTLETYIDLEVEKYSDDYVGYTNGN